MRKYILFICWLICHYSPYVVAQHFVGLSETEIKNDRHFYDVKNELIKQAERSALDKAIEYIKQTHVDIGVIKTFKDSDLKELILIALNFDITRMETTVDFEVCPRVNVTCVKATALVAIEIDLPISDSDWIKGRIDRFNKINEPTNSDFKFVSSLVEEPIMKHAFNTSAQTLEGSLEHSKLSRMQWYNLQLKASLNQALASHSTIEQVVDGQHFLAVDFQNVDALEFFKKHREVSQSSMFFDADRITKFGVVGNLYHSNSKVSTGYSKFTKEVVSELQLVTPRKYLGQSLSYNLVITGNLSQ